MAATRFSFRFVVDAAHHGLRIDTFLASRLRNHSSAVLQRLASAGLITVDDGPGPPDRRVFHGECVVVWLAEPPTPFYPPEFLPLDVLYDDPWMLAVNKPAGMIVHPAGPVGEGTLANVAQGILDRQTRLPGLMRPGIVHRLDRETSGVVLIAKDHLAHAGLTRQFERSDIAKTYVALVAGQIDTPQRAVTLPIGGRSDSLLMSAGSDAVQPRPAETRFAVLARFRSATLLDVRPLSGRKHQIRVHLAAIGAPILGDVAYGDLRATQTLSVDSNGQPLHASRHALHAAAIAFRHPVTNAPLRITAPVPEDFWRTLAR